ncbi:MAG: hypothetical protein MZV63_16745 [Marinilabiliales bacterium]|nr:hypothetical protein [Marinilabiliales bacterium]
MRARGGGGGQFGRDTLPLTQQNQGVKQRTPHGLIDASRGHPGEVPRRSAASHDWTDVTATPR